MAAHIPGRPVLSEACQKRIAELVAEAPPLSPEQRARIALIFRTGRRLHRTQQGSDAA